MLIGFKDFLNNIIIESLHPELKSVITSDLSSHKKHRQVIKTIKSLSSRGEKTGIEGNMPKGSSRAYMAHAEHHSATIDGKPASFKIGTKVAIHAPLDNYHDKMHTDGLTLGEAQNYKENGDHYVNSQYRILHPHDNNSFTTNHEHGIFPPLIEHDHKNNQWSTVGHARNIKKGEFRQLTKTYSKNFDFPTHPNGISHGQFAHALIRDYNKNNGRHYDQGPEHEAHMDHIASHPLVQKFLHHQKEMGAAPHDYQQLGNMGIFEHPDGSKHIVARDHGFDSDVSRAYQAARERQNKTKGKY